MTGCATMLDRPPHNVHIEAFEAGKSVEVSAKVKGVAEGVIETKLPAQLALTPVNTGQPSVVIADSCFEASETQIPKRFNPYAFLNAFNYGAGLLVDAVTGAIWDLQPEVVVPLRRKPGGQTCVPTTVVGESTPTVLLPAVTRLRHHNFYANTDAVLRYSGSKPFDFRSSTSSGGGGGGVAYEYLFSDNLGVMLSWNSASYYRVPPSTADSYAANIDSSMTSAEILLKHYFENLPALNVGLGIGQRVVSTHYFKDIYGPGYTYWTRNEANVDQEITYMLISVGLRTRGSFFVGVDMHLTSPSLIFYNDGGRTTAQTREQQFALINDAQDRKAAEQLHTSLLSATQVNLQLGISF